MTSQEPHDRTAWLKGGDARCAMPPRHVGTAYYLVLLGAPGVGKGTQAELLCHRLGACHLSTGDIFRAANCLAASEHSPSLEAALDCMRRGELVSDETVLGLVRERARCLNCSGGFLLDGFPRTVAQAAALEKLLRAANVTLTAALNYELPIEQIVARLSGRRTCSKCRAVFHTETRPPSVENVCDHCGGPLYQREDDRPESIAVRMQAYENSTRPLIEFYHERGQLITVPADGHPEAIYRRAFESICALPRRASPKRAALPDR